MRVEVLVPGREPVRFHAYDLLYISLQGHSCLPAGCIFVHDDVLLRCPNVEMAKEVRDNLSRLIREDLTHKRKQVVYRFPRVRNAGDSTAVKRVRQQ